MSPQPGEDEHDSTPISVTPRREGETHGLPTHLRRRSLAQELSQGGARTFEQIGSQLGIGQPCKVHLKVGWFRPCLRPPPLCPLDTPLTQNNATPADTAGSLEFEQLDS